MMLLRISFLLGLWLAVFPAAAQDGPLQTAHEAKFGWGKEELRSIALLGDGGIAFTGISEPPRKSGKDILFGTLNSDLSQRKLRVIGREGDDMGYKILPDWDGALLIAGSSEKPGHSANKAIQSRYAGKKDAWLVKVNLEGNIIWDKLYGGFEDDEWLSMDISLTGHYYLAGYQGISAWIAKIDRAGAVVWERTPLLGAKSVATQVKCLQNGDIITAGYFENKGRKDLFLMRLDPKGNTLWEKTFPNAMAADLIENPDGSFAITGMEFFPREKEQMLFLLTGADGKEKVRKSYGEIGPDEGKSIMRAWDGNFYLVGDNSSFGKMARRKRLWVHKISPQGAELWKEPVLFGGKFEDNGFAIAPDGDGSLLVGGMTSSLSGREAWMMRLTDEKLSAAGFSSDLSIQARGFFDENGDGQLMPGENGYFLFSVTNKHASLPSASLSVKIPEASPDFSFHFPDRQEIGQIAPGAAKHFSIPVAAYQSALQGEALRELTLQDPQGKVAGYLKITVLTQDRPMPRLQLAHSQFLRNGAPVKELEKNEPVELVLQIANQGGAVAQGIQAKLEWPEWVTPVSPLLFPEELAPGEQISVRLSFKLSNAFDAETLDLKGALSCLDCPAPLPLRLNLPVKQRSLAAATEIFLDWFEPNPFDFSDPEIPVKTENINIKIRVRSNASLAASNFSVYLNDTLIGKHEKFDGVQLKSLTQAKSAPMQSSQFEREINLREGSNRLVVKAEVNGVIATSEPVVLSYAGRKPNLHLISIGVPSWDLQFTSRDAEDFAKIFEQQKGKLFNNVKISLHNTEQKTTVTELRKLFETKRLDYSLNRIDEKDIMIVFISSHGKTNSEMESFLIPCSDSDPALPESTSLDFQKDIIDRLKRINCQKLLFIDACHSGAGIEFYDQGIQEAEGAPSTSALSQALDKMMTNKGIHMVTSCSPKEKSYELPSVQNSAFTKAILEAFAGAPVTLQNGKTLHPNANRDKVLTFQEVLDFVQIRVPDLIMTHKKNSFSQNPVSNSQGLSVEIPVFQLSN